MDAKLSPPSARRRGPWAVRPWTLVILGLLLMAGTLIQACSDNNGSTGPTFECREQKGGARVLAQCTGSPAPTTGFSNTSAEIRVQVVINPNSITPDRRAGVTAIVTNLNGQPLAGKTVSFSTNVGSLDKVVETTNSDGKASTTLSITTTDATNAANAGLNSATVTAIVEGAVGTGVVNFGQPTTLTITPPSVTLSQTTATTCAFNVQFTSSGGAPPITFSAGIPGNITAGGLYNPSGIAKGTTITDTVTATDSTGATASASVSLTCI